MRSKPSSEFKTATKPQTETKPPRAKWILLCPGRMEMRMKKGVQIILYTTFIRVNIPPNWIKKLFLIALKAGCVILFDNIIYQAWTLSLDESGPRFLDEWSSSYAFSSRLGGSLRCGGHGSPHPRVEWVSRDGFPIGNVTGLREVLPTGNIRFLPFPIDKFRPDVHFATLRCKLSNPSGTIISPEVVVRAVLDTPFHIENPDVVVIRGNNALLRSVFSPSCH
ncbi:Down syndrome cell adhesion molecule-like protein Dscam2 [Folsomia candida]|uniref:Down syndrome cell adhesion molecule-like protein Dscam2 n=1 Tax=Folsomia candida TaxID=158441 RepID=A0A226EE11_FOLCA|nr:Down syndrome cell adhesion molecule-like protein Dscam2 [Folsomia candida]